ncbi:RNA polymerase subunit sigma-70 [Ciceribacter sp. L1K23]|uniref:RNA polymerase sigma factor n=1 Tax=Ciceribacter sp. L1K23 TaxID=2820276 RepID=UPI001B81610B|nr:RNA polymerase subunit sigma-70 [Ciceribacter sp. L1K23]
MNTAEQIEKVARLSHGRLVAILAARTGGVTDAMDALSDAVLRALEVWPLRGVPDNPEGWLVATARNRAADAARRSARAARAADTLAILEEERADMGQAVTPDRTLNLMFVCAHPSIDARMRTPLMLQLVLGLDARRMAGAFLIPPGTLGQRLTRARAKIEAARIGFSIPEGADLAPRLSHVLDAIYVAFTVGTDGEGAGDAKSSSLAREAIWLGSLVAAQMPHEAEAQALFALMLYTQARRPARVDAEGCLVPLDKQDMSLWDARLLDDADMALRLAASEASLGRYQIEAAIAAAHVARRHGLTTDWQAIAALYRGLVALFPTMGALTGLAAALGECGEPAAGLAILDDAEPVQARQYQPWWAVRAHLLAAVGDQANARAAYDQAITLSPDPATRTFLACRKALLLSS